VPWRLAIWKRSNRRACILWSIFHFSILVICDSMTPRAGGGGGGGGEEASLLSKTHEAIANERGWRRRALRRALGGFHAAA